ncbi:hypothetical protein HK104_007976, partial [Borealophlyctis nickersoniae]
SPSASHTPPTPLAAHQAYAPGHTDTAAKTAAFSTTTNPPLTPTVSSNTMWWGAGTRRRRGVCFLRGTGGI